MTGYQINIKIIVACLWLTSILHGSETVPKPVAVITNPCSEYSLINSVDYHPKKNLFCVTYTHGNRVVLYKHNKAGKPELVQTLSNPLAKLSAPQHAVFSPDGKKIVVANWTNETLTIYPVEKNGLYSAAPGETFQPPRILRGYKPHGIAISPCGNFLSIAYGVTSSYGRAVALFRIGSGCKLLSVLQGTQELPGIPKGITFSPDGSCLFVTFSDLNSIAVYDVDRTSQKILPNHRQIIQGAETRISRPEDVKITPDARYCALTNSDQHTVTFYPFDTASNRITQNTPCFVLHNPEAELCFPHGIAFSPDGSFMVITQFGTLETTNNGGFFWDSSTPPGTSKVTIYKR